MVHAGKPVGGTQAAGAPQILSRLLPGASSWQLVVGGWIAINAINNVSLTTSQEKSKR